jgi:hypothetical protein
MPKDASVERVTACRHGLPAADRVPVVSSLQPGGRDQPAPQRISTRGAVTSPDLADLDAVLAKALLKAPSDRYTRCTDFARVPACRSITPSSILLPHFSRPQPAAVGKL